MREERVSLIQEADVPKKSSVVKWFLPVYGGNLTHVCYGFPILCASAWWGFCAFQPPSWWHDVLAHCMGKTFVDEFPRFHRIYFTWLAQFGISTVAGVMATRVCITSKEFQDLKDSITKEKNVRHSPHAKCAGFAFMMMILVPGIFLIAGIVMNLFRAGVPLWEISHFFLTLGLPVISTLAIWSLIFYFVHNESGLVQLSGMLVNNFRDKLQAGLTKMKENSQCEQTFFKEMLMRHQTYHVISIQAWERTFPILAVFLIEMKLGAGLFVLQGLAHFRIKMYCYAMLEFALAMTGMFLPLAELALLAMLTDQWQGLKPTKNPPPVRALAATFAPCIMASSQTQVQMDYMIFMQYIDRTPSGVQLPVIGVVSWELLMNKAPLLITSVPVVLGLALSHAHMM